MTVLRLGKGKGGGEVGGCEGKTSGTLLFAFKRTGQIRGNVMNMHSQVF